MSGGLAGDDRPDGPGRLLTASDPDPVTVLNENGRSRFVLTCEHAGCRIPRNLGDLGVADADLRRHIGWDVGALETARKVAQSIDAVLVSQTYSRLVIDCNRPPDSAEAIPASSDGTTIPGNIDLTDDEKAARRAEIHKPYHDTIEVILNQRTTSRPPPALIAFHSFTPVLAAEGVARPWDLGLLYDHDPRLADLVDSVLEDMDCPFSIAHNEPYTVCVETDYTLPVHGEKRGIWSFLLEVRNDHIDSEPGVERWSTFLADLLTRVEQRMNR